MEMLIDFPGGARVDAHFGPYTVSTDQPPIGGGDATPCVNRVRMRGTFCGRRALAFSSPSSP